MTDATTPTRASLLAQLRATSDADAAARVRQAREVAARRANGAAMDPNYTDEVLGRNGSIQEGDA